MLSSHDAARILRLALAMMAADPQSNLPPDERRGIIAWLGESLRLHLGPHMQARLIDWAVNRPSLYGGLLTTMIREALETLYVEQQAGLILEPVGV